MPQISSRLIDEAIKEARLLESEISIIKNYDTWNCFAIESLTISDATQFLTALGAVVERSSTVNEYVYQMVRAARLNADVGIMYFPEWRLEG